MAAKIASRMNRMAPSGIRKVNEKALAMERAGERVLHFELGRPDFDTPEYIKKAAYQALAEGKVHYTSNFGLMELRQAIADKLKRENNVDYKATEVLVTVGLSEAVFAVLAAILEPGDEILVPDPVWLNYINVPNLLGAKPVMYSLKEENGFQMDLEEVRSKITDKTRAVVIVTPNNPTGGVLEEDVLKELADIAISNDLMVISDEVYERLVYDGAKHISIASLPGMKERTFTMNGMSKAYAMDGWRLGYVVGPAPVIKIMTKIHQSCIMCAPTTSQMAAITAMRECDDEIDMMRDEYNRRRRLLVKSFNDMGLSCFDPKGAFYVFPCIKSTGMTSDEFCKELLYKKRVAIVPGTAFGASGEGYARVSYAYSVEHLVEALSRIREFLQDLKEGKA